MLCYHSQGDSPKGISFISDWSERIKSLQFVFIISELGMFPISYLSYNYSWTITAKKHTNLFSDIYFSHLLLQYVLLQSSLDVSPVHVLSHLLPMQLCLHIVQQTPQFLLSSQILTALALFHCVVPLHFFSITGTLPCIFLQKILLSLHFLLQNFFPSFCPNN